MEPIISAELLHHSSVLSPTELIQISRLFSEMWSRHLLYARTTFSVLISETPEGALQSLHKSNY